MTLTTTQVDNLISAIIPIIKENYEKFLEDLKNGDSFKQAVEELRNSEHMKKLISLIKDRYDLGEKLRNIQKLIDIASKQNDYIHFIFNDRYSFPTYEEDEGDIDTLINTTLDSKITATFNLSSKWGAFMVSYIKNELKAILCLTNEAPFDDIKKEMINRFNAEELHNKFHNK